MMHDEAKPDSTVLRDLTMTEMPYGKYKGRKIAQLPVHYLEWIARNGFPSGRLGMLLSTAHIIKTNGLEHLVRSICASYKAIFIKELRSVYRSGKITYHQDIERLISEVE